MTNAQLTFSNIFPIFIRYYKIKHYIFANPFEKRILNNQFISNEQKIPTHLAFNGHFMPAGTRTDARSGAV